MAYRRLRVDLPPPREIATVWTFTRPFFSTSVGGFLCNTLCRWFFFDLLFRLFPINGRSYEGLDWSRPVAVVRHTFDFPPTYHT